MTKRSANTMATRGAAEEVWREIAKALMVSGQKSDRDLALAVTKYVSDPVAIDKPRLWDVSHGQPNQPAPSFQEHQK
jgi:hypothetical protein